MKLLTMLVGPPGSGKSTMAKNLRENDGDHGASTVYINQDSQGKMVHKIMFHNAIEEGQHIIVDRMNFSKAQRAIYLEPAKAAGYHIVIRVLHEPYAVCLARAIARKNHETIKDEENARQALNFFFKTYERVEDWEADEVKRYWPEGPKPIAIVCDLDGTLCDINHRRHHVRKTDGSKKNWMAFMDGIKDDKLNDWCYSILEGMRTRGHYIVLCSGRGNEQRKVTEEWLDSNAINYDILLMRQAGDSRQDYLVKEIILDFEILTRYSPYFMIDDRQQVVDMWRKRGFVCLQCDVGDF